MMNGSKMGDSSGTVVAAQPQPEVVARTVREVSDTSWLTLTRTNFTELQWEAIYTTLLI